MTPRNTTPFDTFCEAFDAKPGETLKLVSCDGQHRLTVDFKRGKPRGKVMKIRMTEQRMVPRYDVPEILQVQSDGEIVLRTKAHHGQITAPSLLRLAVDIHNVAGVTEFPFSVIKLLMQVGGSEEHQGLYAVEEIPPTPTLIP